MRIWSHFYKGYASTYNVEIWILLIMIYRLKVLNPQLETNMKGFLTELKWFKFVAKLVLEFKRVESDDESKYCTIFFLKD